MPASGMNENPSPTAQEVAQLRAEVGDLRFVIKLTWSIMVLFFSYLSFRALFAVAQFEKIFEDMLGDPDKLPEITKQVAAWSKTGVIAPLVLLLITFASLVAPWLIRNNRVAVVISLVASVLLLAHALICWNACFSPLITVIKSLSGGS